MRLTTKGLLLIAIPAVFELALLSGLVKAQSDAALQLTADIFRLPTRRPHTYETSGLGAAIACAVAVGLHGDFAIAVRRMTRVARTFEPDATNAALYTELAPFEGRNLIAPPNVACFGSASRHLGMLAAAMKRWPDAERHFEAGLAMNTRQLARPWLAHTQHQYAAMLLARDAAGDRERAASLLDEALAAAREIGMAALAERAAALRE